MQLDNLNQSESSPPANTGSVTRLPDEVGVQQNLTDFSVINSTVKYKKLKRDFNQIVILPKSIYRTFIFVFAICFGSDILDIIWNLYYCISDKITTQYLNSNQFIGLPFLMFIPVLLMMIPRLKRLRTNFNKQLSTIMENQDIDSIPFLIIALKDSKKMFLLNIVYNDILYVITGLLSQSQSIDIELLGLADHQILNRYLNAKGVQRTPEFVEAILGAYQYLGIASDLRALKRFSRLKNISPTMINLANVAETAIIRRMEERDSVQTLLRTPTDTHSTLLRVSEASQEDVT